MFKIYFYNHVASYAILLIQILAFGYALGEYWRWKNKASSQSEHKKLMDLFEHVTMLKSALHKFEDSFLSQILFVKVFEDFHKTEQFHELHSDLFDLYNNLVIKVLVLTETKAKIINEIFGLGNVHNSVEKLIDYAEERRKKISELLKELEKENPDLPRIKNPDKINTLYHNVRAEIKSSSKILDSKK